MSASYPECLSHMIILAGMEANLLADSPDLPVSKSAGGNLLAEIPTSASQ